ncbi:MAG: tetratricopeptide repeat protein [Deltaproteobacteria bacterium]|nr:tetratricopeptide repeat protein [Deltaproteobacteria bacterium]
MTATAESGIQPQEVCSRAFALMRDKQHAEAEKLLANCLAKTTDPVATALFHSALGVCAKLQGAMKAAWKHYQRAEKLLPEDPALKLISARLLIEEFAQYDQAIKKGEKALAKVPQNPVVVHHALVTIGEAYGRKGDKRRAIDCLCQAMAGDFQGFVTTKNVDFHLVEFCLAKGWEPTLCRAFLEKAHAFARSVQETDWVLLIARMLAAFPSVPDRVA